MNSRITRVYIQAHAVIQLISNPAEQENLSHHCSQVCAHGYDCSYVIDFTHQQETSHADNDAREENLSKNWSLEKVLNFTSETKFRNLIFILL